MPPPCSETFKVPDGTTLSLMPPFNAKEASYGWGGYRQYNQTNTYKSNAPHNLTVLLNSSPADVQITIGGTSMEYGNAGFLPKVAEWHVYSNEQQGRFLTKYPEIEPTYYGVDVTEDIRNNIFSRQLGKKAYELKDHLGNVRVTFSDIKIPTDVASQPFTVDLLSKSEYYPYGMKINDLSYNATGARYGYNGTHEQELAINPEGNYLDFGDFGYDTRTARRQNIDPMFAAYPHLSGYATFNNNPIYYSDPTGWEGEGQGDGKDCNPLIPDQNGVENVGLSVSNINEKQPGLGDRIVGALNEVTDGAIDDLYITTQSLNRVLNEINLFLIPEHTLPESEYQRERANFPPIVNLEGNEVTPIGIASAAINTYGNFRGGRTKLPNSKIIKGLHKKLHSLGTNTELSTVADDDVISIYNRHPAEATVEGVYILSEALETYVGQTKNFAQRLSKHFGVGGLFANYQNAERILIKMEGSSPLEREIYEQYVIEKFGVLPSQTLLNKRNPMGGRIEKYKQQYENVIKKYNLPRF